ncbi:MAG: AMP-binding protein [Robiginitomaculum sp.]|nr:MAG: AMP-binding protein [Robiginitomaculum sp.]
MSETNLSYVSGASQAPLLYQTIDQALCFAARVTPANEALVSVHQNIRLTYAELNVRVNAIASGLMAIGIEPGERVGIWATNCAEWMITQYATARAGFILVNINPAYRIAEVEYALNKVDCAAIILERQFKTSHYLDILKQLSPNLFAGGKDETRTPSLRHAILIDDGKDSGGLLLFSELATVGTPKSDQNLIDIAPTLQPEDPINIQFTSGTTGAPKGATLTHHNILNNGFFVGRGIKLTNQDRICVPVPLYHCFGMVMGNLAALTHGATIIYPSAGFDPKETLRVIEDEKCTALYGVPTMFIAMLALDEMNTTNFSSLRTGIMAGSPCPVEVMKRVVSDMQMPDVTIAYGMTETSPVSFQSGVHTSLEKRVSTVGTVLPHLEAKIINEDGRVVARGVQGELCTRGYSVMQGYWGDDDATFASIDRRKWMHTGDLAVIDDEGYANITGRAKEVIIRGGENIYPKEIEDHFMRHSAVQDVQVFGVPDNKFGEVSCAWLILKPGEKASVEDISTWLRAQISHYKIPKCVKAVDEFPMTVTGKAQKFLMRKSMMKELGLKEIKTA